VRTPESTRREVFRIEPTGDKWSIINGATQSLAYSTREAAFEAAVGTASVAIKEGSAVVIEVAPPLPGQSLVGNRENT
jgi:hypothetical protein